MPSSSDATTTTRLRRPHRSRAIVIDAFPKLELLRQDGSSTSAESALKGKRYILFYFAAHYLPSCQRFTPQLADFYNENAKKHDFEVVFVSDDRSESRMMDFFQNRSSNYVLRHKKVVPPAAESRRRASRDGALSNAEEDDRVDTDEATGHVRGHVQKNSQRLREQLNPHEPLEVVTMTTKTTMSYNPETGVTTQTTHAGDGATSATEHMSTRFPDAPPVTNTTTTTTTTRTTAQQAIAMLEAQEKTHQQKTHDETRSDAIQRSMLPGHKPRLSARSGYTPREPTASGHAEWLALRYADAQGAVGKWLRRQYKVRSAPRLVVVDAENGQLLVSEGRTMLLRDPHGVAFPWPGADLLIRAERESSQSSGLSQYSFWGLSAALLFAVILYVCMTRLL